MYRPLLAKSLVCAVLACSLAACSIPAGAAALPAGAGAAQLGPGAALGQMTLTTGSRQAVSIWTICQPSTSLLAATQTECLVPSRALAIGPTAASLAEIDGAVEWEEMQWTLLLDGQPIDLDAFGSVNDRQFEKGLAGREVYHLYPAWDVVVAQPTAGRHTLKASVQGLTAADDSATEWVIHFTVQSVN
jgi:hypothetical protein